MAIAATTIDAARRSRAVASDHTLLEMPGLDWAVGELYTGMARFGMWDEILAEAAPNPELRGLTAGYHYARATALAAKGSISGAESELAKLEKLSETAGPDDGAGLNTAKDVFAIAVMMAKARIADARGANDEAIALLKEAAVAEDRLAYDEPADWFVPVRHVLGAALLKAGRAAEAEAVYRDDLRRYPGNGWALFGLAQSLSTQARSAEADAVRREFEKAWDKSDVKLTASAF